MVVEDIQDQLRTLEGGRKEISSDDRGMLKDVRTFVSRALQGGDPDSAPVLLKVGREWALDLLVNRWASLSAQLIRLNGRLMETYHITNGGRRRELLREALREIFDPMARPQYYSQPAADLDTAVRRALREALVAWKDSQGRLSSRLLLDRLSELHLLEPDTEPRVTLLGRYFLALEPRRALTFLVLCELVVGQLDPRRLHHFLKMGRTFNGEEDNAEDQLSHIQAEWLVSLGIAWEQDSFDYGPTMEGRLAMMAALDEMKGPWANLIHNLASQNYQLERSPLAPPTTEGREVERTSIKVARRLELDLVDITQMLEQLSADLGRGEPPATGVVDELGRRLGGSRQLVTTYLRYVQVGEGATDRFSLPELLEEVLAPLRPRFPLIEWGVEMDGGIPALLGPRAELRLVLQELCDNAVRALAGRSGARIQLTGMVMEGGERVRVTISDNGPGLPTSLASGPFEAGSTHDPERLGMGLAMVRRVVTTFRGEVSVNRNIAGGADFVLILPTCLART